MPTVISGDTGIDKVQDGVVVTADLADGAVTPGKLSGGQSGSAPVYGCRAWCTFNGTTTGTNAPLSGGNVTSVTRNGAGDYTINFTTAMPDALYAVVGTCENNGGSPPSGSVLIGPGSGGSLATYVLAGSVRITTASPGIGSAADSPFVSIAIFR